MRKDRVSCIHLTCSCCLIKVPPLNTLPHLPLQHLNSLRKRTVTKTRTDGYTSPVQIIMHLLMRLEWFEDFFYGRMISFLLASLNIKFLLLPSRAAPEGAENNGKLPHLFIPSKTATLVPEFAVEDLRLGRTAAFVPAFAMKDLTLGKTV